MKQLTAAVDFGTSKFVALIADRNAYDGCSVLGSSVVDFAGFTKNGWREPEAVGYVISAAMTQAQKQAEARVRSLSVGVPADFCYVESRKVNLSFGRQHRITQDDVDLLFKRGESFPALTQYGVLHRCPIYFLLNNERKTMNPIGSLATSLGALVCYILADKRFMASVKSAFSREGFGVEDFLAVPLAEAITYIPSDMRDRTSVMVDIGHLSTSVSVVKGDGLLFHAGLPVGGAHITKDLEILLKINPDNAAALKKRVIYGLSAGLDDKYEIVDKNTNRILRFSTQNVQEIIFARLEEMCDIIRNTLANSHCILPEYVPVWLTGGTAGLRGIREMMQKRLERTVNLVQPKASKFYKPEFTSALAVLDLAIDNLAQESASVWEQLGRIFKKKS